MLPPTTEAGVMVTGQGAKAAHGVKIEIGCQVPASPGSILDFNLAIRSTHSESCAFHTSNAMIKYSKDLVNTLLVSYVNILITMASLVCNLQSIQLLRVAKDQMLQCIPVTDIVLRLQILLLA